ncbi:hypothetical protein MUP77_22985 [Candidatus Bathyarchaeota archaeon]|nr:hypothetical protein [Candidatus Bathyarchaeota archaeon]
MSRTSKLAMMVIALVVVAIAAYVAVTYPRTIASTTVSLTAGINSKNVEFDVPWLHERAQIEVMVQSGLGAVWSATISSGNNVLWNNQGSGDYLSDWIKLPAGHYVFTFITLGGALEAQVNIRTKGGIW